MIQNICNHVKQRIFKISNNDYIKLKFFNFDKFYTAAKRMLKPGGLIAVIGYGLISVNDSVDPWLLHFYKNITGPYWDKERKYIDENYQTIPFPFREIKTPTFEMQFEWTSEILLGFLSSWSAVQHFRNKHNRDPIDEIQEEVISVWPGEEIKKVSFPLFIRAGIIEK